jgi:hypothetical protein
VLGISATTAIVALFFSCCRLSQQSPRDSDLRRRFAICRRRLDPRAAKKIFSPIACARFSLESRRFKHGVGTATLAAPGALADRQPTADLT